MPDKILKCIIVDDEQHARALIKSFVDTDNRLVCINSFSTVFELEKSGLIEQADLLFLDVEMPGKSGVDFLKDLKIPVKTVLTTAYKDYAIDGFNLNVLDFLLKPIFEERFKQCVGKIYNTFEIELKAKKYDTAQNFDNKYIILKSGYDELKIWLKDIIYVSAADEYVRFHTTTKEHLIYMRLKEIEKLLPSSNFIRTHRSFIVAKAFVNEIKKGNLLLNNLSEIPVSRSNKSKLEQLFR